MVERKSKYCLAFVELYNQRLHSMWDVKELHYKYLTSIVIDLEDFYSGEYKNIQSSFMDHYYQHLDPRTTHREIENYNRIVKNHKYYELNIVEIHYDGDFQIPYHTAVLKTHYLRLLQRRWKRIYKERKEKIRHLKKPSNLIRRSQYGH